MSNMCKFNEEKTLEIVNWIDGVLKNENKSDFEKYQIIVKRLGALHSNNSTEIIFWVPELKDYDAKDIFIELFIPEDVIEFEKDNQEIKFKKQFLEVKKTGDFAISVINNTKAGNKNESGYYYQLIYKNKNNNFEVIRDPLAFSLPFGVFSPAEIYDIEKLNKNRKDKDYFRNLKCKTNNEDTIKLDKPVNILQAHISYSSEEGTIRGFTNVINMISNKIKNNEPLSLFEKSFLNYDSIQLMPIEPVVEMKTDKGFWFEEILDNNYSLIMLNKPNMINWGYDVVIFGTSAINPVLLGSKRPDELIELIEALHNFPNRPIKLIYDVVYGHADNQGLELLNEYFFTKPNMYGQDLNYRHSVVKAILLEMQRRKTNYGIDGVRVDGAQDFMYYNNITEKYEHDDEYLQCMSDVKANIDGFEYYPWFIFEDGRPWPREDWELASTYREVIKNQPDIFQWSPLSFAHNTPFLYTFWVNKFWRVKEIVDIGSNWITGCSNHDTLRRGTQVDPNEKINNRLGKSLKKIIKNAYDNPAEFILSYCVFPGIPMYFLNSLLKSPWSFMRNTDTYYLVKIASDENRFLDWMVEKEDFDKKNNFLRLKKLGFKSLNNLKLFINKLKDSVELTNYNIEEIVKILKIYQTHFELEINEKNLNEIAKAWMYDLHDYCNITNWKHELEENKIDLHFEARKFRLNRPWLSNNLNERDVFNYIHPTNGSVIYYSIRTSPDNKEKIFFIANMEGEEKCINIENIISDKLDYWQVEINATDNSIIEKKVNLKNGEAIILIKKI